MKKVQMILSVLLVLLVCSAAAEGVIVGTEISGEDIADFYYTVDASTDPPFYLRYRFYAEDGKHWFFHETRQGDSWPQTEEDITATGTVELSEDEWSLFIDCLRGGAVQERSDEVVDGDEGPWIYLYTEGDETGREFSFASPEERLAFEEFCAALQTESAEVNPERQD